MDDIEPKVGAAKELTLSQVIRDLDEISWKLNNQVFGERPEKEPAVPKELAGDKICQARNEVRSITDRLRKISDRLNVL